VRALVHRAGHRLVAEQVDGTLGLAPAAEVEDVAEVAASVGALGRLAPRFGAEADDEIGRVGKGGAVGDGEIGLQSFPRGKAAKPLPSGERLRKDGAAG
jgi:hypothetical protein